MTGPRRSLWLACAALFAAGILPAGDSLRPQNTTTQDLGALVDGSRDAFVINDEAYVAIQSEGFLGMMFPVIPLANYLPALHSEVIGFAHRRPPLLIEDVSWTAGSNTIDLNFQDELLIDVTFWIVDATEGLPEDVADRSLETAVIFDRERLGVAFDDLEIIDASDDPDAAQFEHFTCALASEIKQQIGFVPGMINAYYTTTVNFGGGVGTGNGVWCGGGVIALGRNTTGNLLAHEFGHAFHIHHVNSNTADFDGTNVMHSSSSNRRYLTEGQTFHAVYHAFSDLNDIYDVRAGQPTRSCPENHYSVDDPICPADQKRVWADGASWPPN